MCIVIIVIAIVLFTPLAYWIMNPEATYMQVVLKFWWMYLIIIIGYILIALRERTIK